MFTATFLLRFLCWFSGMVYGPMRLASCPSRWLSLVCRRLTPLVWFPSPRGEAMTRLAQTATDDQPLSLCDVLEEEYRQLHGPLPLDHPTNGSEAERLQA